MGDIWTLLTARRRTSPGLPLVTYVDALRGERTELSAASVENAAAKIANALRDEYGLDAGASVGLALPLHWQRSTWCAGVWTAGCVVVLGEAVPDADLVVAGPAQAADLAGRTTGQVLVASLHPLGLPATDPLPPGTEDVTLAVRLQPDAYLFEPPAGSLGALLADGQRLLTQDQVLDLARRRAVEWSLGSGGRLLVDEAAGALDAWLGALAVPLAVGASAVLVRGPYDAAAVGAQERTTSVIAPSR